ncbi:TetR family transcriptional regulator [Corynebacterium sp. CNJ-954]|nr:TetR/AcrR family transcriptional regulator [Corynebacterium sp. CNJ-954]OLT52051.1 TetR family transcriptional regulator [Corynebacterium sp. CNJ-954]
MRTSKKDVILRAAVGIIESDGLDAVTYESLADASGMSKSGLIYHFPSRHELMLGVHRFLAGQWEEELESAAGGAAGEVSPAERLRAMVLSLSRSATRADLLLQVDSRTHRDFVEVWRDVDERWLPPVDGVDGDGKDADLKRAAYLVQILADGLWMHDHVHDHALTDAQRKALTSAILELIP